MPPKLRSLLVVLAALLAAACSGIGGEAPAPGTPPAASTAAAVRTQPVVPGRRARVFVMSGFGKACEPLPAPEIVVSQPPAKGDVSFVPGQETTIQDSAQGTCVGQKATGTGIYYTARAGQTGSDRFAVTAKLASGETSSRTFEVTIAE